jgi:hypothetical protein
VLKHENTARLIRKWPEYSNEFHELNPDYDMTTAAICSTLGRKNHLDCSNQRG